MGLVEVNAVIFVTIPLLVYSTGGWLYYCCAVFKSKLHAKCYDNIKQ